MHTNTTHLRAALALLAVLLPAISATLRADEGMWLFNSPPLAQLKQRHNFAPDPAWFAHVRQSSVRFNNGGSGSFVSPDGLVVTNHHVAADSLYKLSTPAHDYLANGFYARTRADELKCPDLELNVLVAIENVTARVNAAVTPAMTPDEAAAARRAAKAAIEKENLEKTGLRSDIVTLYQGAEYHLYQYKRYTDIRIVFAPEQQAAYFGGDPDNFEFPRYDLDCAFVRVYENDRPAHIENYFKWSATGASENDLVFVSGHPGNPSRSLTAAEFAFLRDTRVPFMQTLLKNLEVRLISWGARSLENERRAHDDLNNIQNARKVYDGRAAALLNPAVMSAKQADDDALRTYARANSYDNADFRTRAYNDALAKAKSAITTGAEAPTVNRKLETVNDFTDTLAAWDDIAAAQKTLQKNFVRSALLESMPLSSTLSRIARTLLRAAGESLKPNGDRLREFRDSDRPSLELALFSDEPIYPDYEIVKLTEYLTLTAQKLGVDDPAVRALLAGKSPAERAAELINDTKLADVSFRRQLYAMTPAQLAAVDDPMLAAMRSIDADARAARKINEEQAEIIEQAHAKIARVRYARDGDRVYPDATFTLRLSYGTIKGFHDEQGRPIAPFTRIAGLYERAQQHQNREPFNLPQSWADAATKGRINKDTPMNFVSTTDIIGGNSGSPVLNRNAEFVGLIFDGNIQSLAGDYYYDIADNRAVSVDARAIIEALRSVYHADALADELLPAQK